MNLVEQGRAAIGLVAIVASASCVPASEPADAAGAIGFVTEPTAAALGQPFETEDGWTVRVEMLVLQMNVSASTSSGDPFGGGRYSGDYAQYRLAASARAEIFGRGLHVGPATATVSLGGAYIRDDYDADDDAENIGVPAEIQARFLRPADAALASLYPTYSGPSVLLVARAEREGRVVTVDFTMSASSYTAGEGQPTAVGEVRADALIAAPLVIIGEALFQDTRTGRVVFDDFAAADANGDGLVTGAEIGATSAFTAGPVTGDRVHGLIDDLVPRAGRMLVVR